MPHRLGYRLTSKMNSLTHYLRSSSEIGELDWMENKVERIATS